MLFPLVESSLPEETLRIYGNEQGPNKLTPHSDASVVNVATYVAKDRLTSLMIFLGREVESKKRIQMAKTCFEINDFR